MLAPNEIVWVFWFDSWDFWSLGYKFMQFVGALIHIKVIKVASKLMYLGLLNSSAILLVSNIYGTYPPNILCFLFDIGQGYFFIWTLFESSWLILCFFGIWILSLYNWLVLWLALRKPIHVCWHQTRFFESYGLILAFFWSMGHNYV